MLGIELKVFHRQKAMSLAPQLAFTCELEWSPIYALNLASVFFRTPRMYHLLPELSEAGGPGVKGIASACLNSL